MINIEYPKLTRQRLLAEIWETQAILYLMLGMMCLDRGYSFLGWVVIIHAVVNFFASWHLIGWEGIVPRKSKEGG